MLLLDAREKYWLINGVRKGMRIVYDVQAVEM